MGAMILRIKRIYQYIHSSIQSYHEDIIHITKTAQLYFFGSTCVIYSLYMLSAIVFEHFAFHTWTPQYLYSSLICILSGISWFMFKGNLLPRNYVLPVSNLCVFLLLILLSIARGLGGIYIPYGLAACTAIATVILSLNPFCYTLFALLAAICEFLVYLSYTEFNFSFALYYTFTETILLFIVSVCLNLFISIVRYRILDETSILKKESSTDALTRLYNRKYFEHYVQFNHRDDELSAMIHLDLDNFKKLNDTLGHQQGDALLIRVAEILRASFRKTDCVARVGGDEFMVFMPSLSESRHAVARVRTLLEQFPILIQEQDVEIPVAVSIGVAFSEEGQFPSYQALYERADEAMYQAKKAGKMRAVIPGYGEVLGSPQHNK